MEQLVQCTCILPGHSPWVQHIWRGPEGTLEPERGLDLWFSYVMSEWCLFVYFQKTQSKKGFSP